MTCTRCRKGFEENQPRCPHCGEPNPGVSGMFQTSTVMIAAGDSHRVYRSVEDVPAGLRTRLLKSTNGSNSATILIADRRGRKEIAKAMRNLPGPAQRRLVRSILGSEATSAAARWLTPFRKRVFLAVIVALAVALVTVVFTHRF